MGCSTLALWFATRCDALRRASIATHSGEGGGEGLSQRSEHQQSRVVDSGGGQSVAAGVGVKR